MSILSPLFRSGLVAARGKRRRDATTQGISLPVLISTLRVRTEGKVQEMPYDHARVCGTT